MTEVTWYRPLYTASPWPVEVLRYLERLETRYPSFLGFATASNLNGKSGLEIPILFATKYLSPVQDYGFAHDVVLQNLRSVKFLGYWKFCWEAGSYCSQLLGGWLELASDLRVREGDVLIVEALSSCVLRVIALDGTLIIRKFLSGLSEGRSHEKLDLDQRKEYSSVLIKTPRKEEIPRVIPRIPQIRMSVEDILSNHRHLQSIKRKCVEVQDKSFQTPLSSVLLSINFQQSASSMKNLEHVLSATTISAASDDDMTENWEEMDNKKRMKKVPQENVHEDQDLVEILAEMAEKRDKHECLQSEMDVSSDLVQMLADMAEEKHNREALHRTVDASKDLVKTLDKEAEVDEQVMVNQRRKKRDEDLAGFVEDLSLVENEEVVIPTIPRNSPSDVEIGIDGGCKSKKSSAGQKGGVRKCCICAADKTAQWRNIANVGTTCNACGLSLSRGKLGERLEKLFPNTWRTIPIPQGYH